MASANNLFRSRVPAFALINFIYRYHGYEYITYNLDWKKYLKFGFLLGIEKWKLLAPERFSFNPYNSKTLMHCSTRQKLFPFRNPCRLSAI